MKNDIIVAINCGNSDAERLDGQDLILQCITTAMVVYVHIH